MFVCEREDSACVCAGIKPEKKGAACIVEQGSTRTHRPLTRPGDEEG